MRSIQNTASRTYRQLMGNGLKYKVPRFQRDYSWGIEQWDDLWLDIQDIVNNGEEHYMGYLVFQTNDNKNYIIVDGQQRFTTLSIIVLVVLKCLNDLVENQQEVGNNQKRIELIRNTYIGVYDTVTLTVKSKLKLNRNGDRYYQKHLLKLGQLPVRNTNHSEKAMRKCFDWYYKKIKTTYKTGVNLASFIDAFVDDLYFTVIEVNDTINAYKVFETINARGVQLSSADLLKNYLFSIVDIDKEIETEERIAEMEKSWNEIIAQLHGEKIETYLRYYWNSKYKTTRKNQLFKTIKKAVKNVSDVFELLDGLETDVGVYMSLRETYSSHWTEHQEYAGIKESLDVLQLFRVKQTYSLLLAGYRSLKPNLFKKLVKICEVIAFRYNIIGKLNPNDMESIYNDIALEINRTKELPYASFRKVYVSNEDFKHKFTNIELSAKNPKLPRYILSKLEYEKSGQEISYSDSNYTLEHVLPQNAQEVEWSAINADDYERMVDRLGNMSLLESSKNGSIGNAHYEQKKKVYSMSNCALTSSIPSHYPIWSVGGIVERQRQLAKLATQIWSVQELESLHQ